VLDHFARLGLEARFHLDPDDVAARHRESLRRVHPDRHALAPSAGRRLAIEESAALNDALRTLGDPLLRVEHLLALRAAPGPAEAVEALAGDAAFRMEMVELEDAFDELEAVDGREERDRIARAVAVRYERGLAALGARVDAGAAGLAEAVEAARLRRLAELLLRWNRSAA
jgi:molecular chaperone HscB